LIIVDLHKTDRKALDTYMGRDIARRFLELHALDRGDVRRAS
jgi:hypothetical protein